MGDVKIRIKAIEAFQKGLNRAIAGIKKLGSIAKSFGRTMLRAAKFGIAGLTGISIWSVKTASDINEMGSKFKVVFGEITEETDKWAEDLANGVGRSKNKIKSLLADVQDLVVPMSETREEAAELSKNIVKLGLDVASFQNKNDPEVIQAMAKALLGERESLKTYGIAIKEAEVKQEAFNLGLAKNTKFITDAAKAQATFSLILKKSKDAQGDLARTSLQFANRVRTLKDKFFEFRVELGNQILDGLKLEGVIGRLSEKFQQFTNRLAKSKAVEMFAQRVSVVLEDALGALDDFLQGGEKQRAAIDKFKQIGSFIGNKLLSFGLPIGEQIAKGFLKGIKSLGLRGAEELTKTKFAAGGRAIGSLVHKAEQGDIGSQLIRDIALPVIPIIKGLEATGIFDLQVRVLQELLGENKKIANKLAADSS